MNCVCGHEKLHHEELLHGGRGECANYDCACVTFRSATPAADMVNHPPHYNTSPSGIECIEVVEHLNFCIGNAIKYLWRCDGKNGLEDLKKARWYVDREIARREKAGA